MNQEKILTQAFSTLVLVESMCANVPADSPHIAALQLMQYAAEDAIIHGLTTAFDITRACKALRAELDRPRPGPKRKSKNSKLTEEL